MNSQKCNFWVKGCEHFWGFYCILPNCPPETLKQFMPFSALSLLICHTSCLKGRWPKSLALFFYSQSTWRCIIILHFHFPYKYGWPFAFYFHDLTNLHFCPFLKTRYLYFLCKTFLLNEDVTLLSFIYIAHFWIIFTCLLILLYGPFWWKQLKIL